MSAGPIVRRGTLVSTSPAGASRPRAPGLAALAILAVAAAHLPLIAGIAASSAVLIAVATSDTVRDGVQSPRLSA